jgi:hypothetical protein
MMARNQLPPNIYQEQISPADKLSETDVSDFFAKTIEPEN